MSRPIPRRAAPPRRRVLRRAASGLAWAGCGSAAWAASASPDAVTLAQISVVSEAPPATASATPNAGAGDVGGVTGIGGGLRPVDAASAGVFSGAQIDSRPVTRPGEVLEEVPGLIVTQHSGEGKANQFFLRGFGSLRLRDFGPRPLIGDNAVRSKPTALRDGRIGYDFENGTTLAPDLLNLTDAKADPITDFYESRLPGEPAGGVADRHFHPVEPTAVRSTLAGRL